MTDARLHELAKRQHNRISRAQLEAAGLSRKAIEHRLRTGRLMRVAEGVFAFPPVIESDHGAWSAAVLTSPGSYLNRLSAACAWGILERRPTYETVVRPGSGGPRAFNGIVVYRSSTLDLETTTCAGFPITSMPRTLLDLASFASNKALARAVRESIRLRRTSVEGLVTYLGARQGRRGILRLARALASHEGLPIERARSGAEVRALEVLRDAGRPMPRLNAQVAGVEADLSWPRERLIIEIDGAPFHQDIGADASKDAAWRGAGWRVERIPSDAVYERPQLLLAYAPQHPLRGRTSESAPYRG